MNFIPVTTQKESSAAFTELRGVLRRNAERITCAPGWQGGNQLHTVNWHPSLGFWSALAIAETRYWCAYGTQLPVQGKKVNITCEINPAIAGVTRQVGGVFLKDSNSNYYLAHSGKVAGGRTGIGKTNFLAQYKGDPISIEWPDGVTSNVVLLGQIGGRAFLNTLVEYIRDVDAFKSAIAGQIPPEVTERNESLFQFTPEFQGRRKKYTLREAIVSHCNHGKIINALQREFESRGIESYNSQRIDLALTGVNDIVTHIFEAKTNISTTDLYQGVGQLMLHGALDPEPRRILVLPEFPSTKTLARLERLGIEIVRYQWVRGKVAFSDLTRFLPISLAVMLSFSLTWS
jgi:hypothetical protein